MTAAEVPAAVSYSGEQMLPFPPRPIAPALISEARRLYERTNVPVRDIAALVGLSERTLYVRIHKWKWAMRCDRMPDKVIDAQIAPELLPAQPASGDSQMAEATADNAGLAERMQRAIERELAAVETLIAKLGTAPENAADAERSARTLAMLSRVLRELAKLRQDEQAEDQNVDTNEEQFRDLDDFSRELAEQLDRLRRSRDA